MNLIQTNNYINYFNSFCFNMYRIKLVRPLAITELIRHFHHQINKLYCRRINFNDLLSMNDNRKYNDLCCQLYKFLLSCYLLPSIIPYRLTMTMLI